MIPGQEVKGTRILAKSLFKELRGNGYSTNQILSLSTELIDLVTENLRADQELPPHATEDVVAGTWRAAM
jgi:hypothetical protein